MEFYKNDLLDKVLDRNFETWEHTLDTGDFINVKYGNKIDKYIFLNLKKQLNEMDIYYLLKLKYQGIKLGFFASLKVWLSGIEPKYQALHQEEYKNFINKQKLEKKKRKNKKT